MGAPRVLSGRHAAEPSGRGSIKTVRMQLGGLCSSELAYTTPANDGLFDQISDTLAAGGLEEFQLLIEDYEREQNVPAIEIAAALYPRTSSRYRFWKYDAGAMNRFARKATPAAMSLSEVPS